MESVKDLEPDRERLQLEPKLEAGAWRPLESVGNRERGFRVEAWLGAGLESVSWVFRFAPLIGGEIRGGASWPVLASGLESLV